MNSLSLKFFYMGKRDVHVEKNQTLCYLFFWEVYELVEWTLNVHYYKAMLWYKRLCSQLKMGLARRQPIPLSFTKARFTVKKMYSEVPVIDTVSDLLTDFPVGTRLHWMRKAMRERLETPRWGTHHWTRPIHSRSANTHTAR